MRSALLFYEDIAVTIINGDKDSTEENYIKLVNEKIKIQYYVNF